VYLWGVSEKETLGAWFERFGKKELKKRRGEGLNPKKYTE